MHVLVIEDNPDILANLCGYLEPLGYTIDSSRNGVGGLVLATEHSYDAIVLDLMLPGMDGLEVCRKLRGTLRQSTPVLMLTARDTVRDKVAGFESGADDYLVKPFSLIELEIRLRALSRRANAKQVDDGLKFGELRFDPAIHEASRAGRTLHLTPTGYKLLATLLRAAPKLVSRAQLEHEVWGDHPPDSDALRTHIHALRSALDKPFAWPMLMTIPGVGYRLVDADAA